MTTANRPDLPDPETTPELFDGLLTRRVIAYFIDVVILAAMSALLIVAGLIVGLLTLGLGWLLLPMVVPVVILAYYAATLGSPSRATIGMAMMDIILTPTTSPLEGWAILIHPIVFWITIWIAWPFILVALFTPRRQMLHDLVTGTLMLRKSPMRQHWSAARA